MVNPRPIRVRTAVVAGTAALLVGTVTGNVSAHDGGTVEGTIHACANTATGALRVLADPTQACRPGETPMHWTVGGGSSEDLEAFKVRLLATDNVADLVDWSNLQGVPPQLADGEISYQELLGGLPVGAVTSATVLDNSLTSADILNGTVQGEDLGAGSVTSSTISDGAVTSQDLAGSYGSPSVPGAVTSEKIADGSVEPRDLRPEVASATTGAAPVALSATAENLGSAVVTATARSLVMVSGQVQLTCASCTDGVVSYQLTQGGTTLGPVYRVQLSAGHAEDVASFSHLDTVADGTYQYGLRLSLEGSSGGITASDLVLTAQVLGAG